MLALMNAGMVVLQMLLFFGVAMIGYMIAGLVWECIREIWGRS